MIVDQFRSVSVLYLSGVTDILYRRLQWTRWNKKGREDIVGASKQKVNKHFACFVTVRLCDFLYGVHI
jgi:hypothetical protein